MDVESFERFFESGNRIAIALALAFALAFALALALAFSW